MVCMSMCVKFVSNIFSSLVNFYIFSSLSLSLLLYIGMLPKSSGFLFVPPYWKLIQNLVKYMILSATHIPFLGNFPPLFLLRGLPDGKVFACSEGDLGSIPGSGRSPEEGHGNPFQHSCLENPMDRGAWWAIVHGIAKSQTQLSD